MTQGYALLLKRHCRTRSENVQRSAVISIGTIGNKDDVPALLSMMRKSKSVNLKESIIRALSAIGDPSAVQPIMDLLKEKETRIQAAAIEALGRHGKQGSRPLIAFHA